MTPAITSLWPATVPLFAAAITATLAYLYSLANSARQRRLEKENVTRALLTEIRALNAVITRRLAWWTAEVNPAQWLPPLVPLSTPMFEHQGSYISLLNEDVTEQIVKFYGYLHFINEFQRAEEAYVKNGKSQEFYDRYTRILRGHLDTRGDTAFESYYQEYASKR